MVPAFLICVCLFVSVYGQTATKTTHTEIFVDPLGSPQAFHTKQTTANVAGGLVSQSNLNDITQNLQGFTPSELPDALKSILASAASGAGSTSPAEAVRIANHNSDQLLKTDGERINKVMTLFQNQAALEQALLFQRQQDNAAKGIQDELKRIAELQQQQQQQLLQQQIRQQQQQGNAHFKDNAIPTGNPTISSSLLSISSSEVTDTTNPFSGTRGSSGSSISTTSTSSNTATQSSKSKKKRELEARLKKLKEKIAKKKRERAEKEKAKKAAEQAAKAAEEAAQRQIDDLSRNNEFNTEGTSQGVSSQDVLFQAQQNAAAEARIAEILGNQQPAQIPGTPVVPVVQTQRAFSSGVASQFLPSSTVSLTQTAPNMVLGPSFSNQNAFFQSGSQGIGTIDISNAQSLSTQANAIQGGSAAVATSTMPRPARRGFLGVVNYQGEVVPFTSSVSSYQYPNNFQFATPLQSNYVTIPTTYSAPVPSYLYQTYAPMQSSFNMVSPIITGASSSLPGINIPFSPSGINSQSFSFPATFSTGTFPTFF